MVTTTKTKAVPAAHALSAAPAAQAEFTPREGDIIDDILRRVLEMAPSFSAAIAKKISQETRHDWNGDRPYISQDGGQEYKTQRDQRMLKDWQRGERIPLLVRRYGISERRVRQILFKK